jgi:hypothetical protein
LLDKFGDAAQQWKCAITNMTFDNHNRQAFNEQQCRGGKIFIFDISAFCYFKRGNSMIFI